jgi:hypothetical protein
MMEAAGVSEVQVNYQITRRDIPEKKSFYYSLTREPEISSEYELENGRQRFSHHFSADLYEVYKI